MTSVLETSSGSYPLYPPKPPGIGRYKSQIIAICTFGFLAFLPWIPIFGWISIFDSSNNFGRGNLAFVFAYAAAAPGSVDEMIHALILKEGRMPGIARGRSLYAAFLGVPGMPPPQHLVEGRRKRLADVSDLMGEEFARELERRLRRETGQE